MNRKGTQCAVYPCGSEVAAQCFSVTNKNGYKLKNPARKSIENLFFYAFRCNRESESYQATQMYLARFSFNKAKHASPFGFVKGKPQQCAKRCINTRLPHGEVSSVGFHLIKPNTLHRLGLLKGNPSHLVVVDDINKTKSLLFY